MWLQMGYGSRVWVWAPSPPHTLRGPLKLRRRRSRPRTPVAPLDGRLSHPQAAFLHAPATPAPL